MVHFSRHLAAGFLLLFASTVTQAQGMGDMAGMAPPAGPTVPLVMGFSGGEEILFLHTEASDAKIATLLSEMMGSPVFFVPALALIPPEAKARVYVFTNGVAPDGPRGPFGFQPDVFPNPPGDEGYTPLREVIRVTWADPQSARVLRSAAEVMGAALNGELALEPTGIIVNMPIVKWPGGQR